MAVPTGTYTIQDKASGLFATASLAIGQPIQFLAKTGAQNQVWSFSTVIEVSTIKSSSLLAYAWVKEPISDGELVQADQVESKWVTAVKGNQGTIQTDEGEKLFWKLDSNNRAVLAKAGAQFIFTPVKPPQ